MEIEKLIERLDDWEGCDAIYKGKFVEANCRIASRLLEEAASALEQLQAENDRLKSQVPRWIPVEERLPKPEFAGQQRGFYLVALSNGTVKELMYEFRHYENMMFDIGWHETAYPVTHWMALLEAPKEDKKDA